MKEVAQNLIARDLAGLGLVETGEPVRFTALQGGVSSDIFKVEAGDRVFVIKRALPKLRVAGDWQAPTSRNRHEADWLSIVGRILPGSVARLLARDDDAGLFAMEYLDPALFPVWKERLRDGHVDLDFAAVVGRSLASIHAQTAGVPAVAELFATDAVFHAIRLEPYFEAAAQRHPEIASPLLALSARTLATKVALVHGDVSPKNILVGPHGPVFLDAECAWFGDPAFDLAFCINHLLLKCLWNQAAAPRLIEAFESLTAAYREGVTWESPAALEERAARLVGALLLARVDGKSPVEYLSAGDQKLVREVALPLIAMPPRSLEEIEHVWAARLGI
ncbi:MAG TPA: phosphotransferase [Bryobacteraceae bacterium]|nr:phosphotransferase [Bryobacteraceae bacterium]